MTSLEPGSAREAAERTAAAVMTGNLAQVMADLTPEAMTQMMQLGQQAGGLAPTSMPSIEGYEIVDAPSASEDASVFNVTFRSAVGTATLATTWKQVMGQWKVIGVGLVETAPAEGTG